MNCQLSVVIPTLGESPHLRGLLERLQRQRTEFSFEVLVIANIPQQQLRTLVNSMGTNSQVSFGYLETGRLGVNVARNKGLERARGEIVLFLDDDMILENDSFIELHVVAHREHESAVAVGGPYRLIGTHSLWDSVYQDIAHDWLKRQRIGGHGTTQLLGGNISLKKSAMTANSWTFDEVIGFGGAETSLCMRISAAGHKLLFFDSLVIGHAPQMGARKFFRKAFLQGAGAKWRLTHLSVLATTQVNAYLPERIYQTRAQELAARLYSRFFDFGWNTNPYLKAKGGAPLQLNPAEFIFYTISRLQPSARIRILHRRLYTTVRSAWLNGAAAVSARRAAKPR